MENTLYIALSKQTALWRQLDMIANNLANVNTTGYKKASSHFTEYLSETKSDEALLSDRLSFVHDSGTVRDFSEGVFSPTGNPFDLALHGSAFFVVETNEGIRYTRNGQFKINDEGMLVTGNNDPVLDERNNPVFIAPQETEFNVTKDGVILKSPDCKQSNLKISKNCVQLTGDCMKTYRAIPFTPQNPVSNKA